MHKEQYSTAGASAEIEQVGDRLEWSFDKGGVTISGSQEIDEDGLGAALHRARVAVDAAAVAVAEPVAPEMPAAVPGIKTGEANTKANLGPAGPID